MAKEQAAKFLEKMMVEPELQANIKEAYRQMVCDIARKAGFSFSPQELQMALLLKEYRLADEMLEKTIGGYAINMS
jgi:predicted ribosomally synthesized peptide with nif11-like leader